MMSARGDAQRRRERQGERSEDGMGLLPGAASGPALDSQRSPAGTGADGKLRARRDHAPS